MDLFMKVTIPKKQMIFTVRAGPDAILSAFTTAVKSITAVDIVGNTPQLWVLSAISF